MEGEGGTGGQSSLLDGTGDEKENVRAVAKSLKSNVILLWEAATSVYQAYTIISSGAFEDAWYNLVPEQFNVTVNGTTVNVSTRAVREVDLELHLIPRYPETALINVTVYTLAVALLLLFSLLYGLKIVRRLFTSIVLVLIPVGVVSIFPALVFTQLSALSPFSVVVISIFMVILLGIIVGTLAYGAYKAHEGSPFHREMLRVEYVAIVLFFQVFDLMKDSFFLATSTDDPLFFLLTIFDMQLSWLMIMELYAEPGFDLTITNYIKAIIQCTIQAGILLLVPSILVFIGSILFAMFFERPKPKGFAKKVACKWCTCCGLTKPGAYLLSIIVDNERVKAEVAGLSSAENDTDVESDVTAQPGPHREALKRRAKQLKTVSVLLWESATSFYQVYSLVAFGSFEAAYFTRTFVNATQTASEVNTLVWLVPTYPETALINVTVHSVVVSSLAVLSTLYVCNVVINFHGAIVIVSFCVAILCVFPVLPYVTFLKSSAVAIALYSAGGVLAVAGLGYIGFKLLKHMGEYRYSQTVLIQYVSVIVFFQVYDMAKDVFIIVVAPEDPFVLILTVFDIVLSLLMIIELYAEPDYGFGIWEYLSCILHYATVTIAVILLPGVYVFCALISIASLLFWPSREPESTNEHTYTYDRIFYFTKTKHIKTALFSVLVSKELERDVILSHE